MDEDMAERMRAGKGVTYLAGDDETDESES
jgi:hypothetical protein